MAAQRPQSILLNATPRPRHQFTLTPPPDDRRGGPDRRDSSSSSLSSSSASTSSAARSNARQPSPPSSVGRKIKFAPLPDPRKLEEEEAAETSSVTTVDDEDVGFSKSPLKAALDILPIPALPPSDRTSLAASPKGWGSKLLGPLLTKNTSPPSTVDLNPLFRTSSLESVQSTQSTTSTRSRGRFSFSSWKSNSVPLYRTSSHATIAPLDKFGFVRRTLILERVRRKSPALSTIHTSIEHGLGLSAGI